LGFRFAQEVEGQYLLNDVRQYKLNIPSLTSRSGKNA